MKKYYFPGLLAILVVGAFLVYRPAPGKPDGSKSVAGSASPPVTSPKSTAPKVLAAQVRDRTTNPRILNAVQFADRFNLSDIQLRKLRTAAVQLALACIEAKGSGTTVVSNNGDSLVLFVPGLRIGEKDLETMILAEFGEGLGEAKVAEILADPDGRHSLFDQIELARLAADSTYTFVKTKAENHPERNGSSGYAAFDVTWTQVSPGQSGEQRSTFKHTGFSFHNVYNIGLGWSGLAKAPSGYFTSQEISAIRSGPRAVPILNYDPETGKFELKDKRSDSASGTIDTTGKS
jgi:hypothetical protein